MKIGGIMRQFFIFIGTAFGIAIFDLVDSAFGNNLGIDSICVLSAFTIISWCAYVLVYWIINNCYIKLKMLQLR